ncbi:MAG TPA: hypothetical protein VMU56_04470 [Beijerinckiaceae bacterium]|nr:hypothetical protein [Beijerinckiaceae bacterium]
MSEDAPQITTLSDISANMFAAFILILIMVAASAASRRPAASAPPGRTITERDLHFVQRQALDPQAMVRLLYDRRPGARGTSVDLFASGLALSAGAPSASGILTGGSEADLANALNSALGAQAGPVRLYVFSNKHYAATAKVLAQAGFAWREISVPRALRRHDGDGWRPSFRALLREAGNFSAFRAGLARILQAGDARSAKSRERAMGSAEQARAEVLIVRFWRFLHALVNIIALLSAGGIVFLIERRTGRAHIGEIG